MKVSDILVRDASLLELEAQDKEHVLAELARALGDAEPTVDADRLLRGDARSSAREPAILPTAVHARSDALEVLAAQEVDCLGEVEHLRNTNTVTVGIDLRHG